MAVLATLFSGIPLSALFADDPIPLPSKSDKWIEVRTQNFTLYGNASESKTKDVGLEMERLRAVLVALKRGSPTVPVPTRVYVFKNHDALEPYLPRVGGKPARLSGFYRPGWDANYATLSAAWNLDPRPTVFYAYIYDFIRANFAKLPLWYEVGIAGYYSTFRTEGDEARTGMISEGDLHELRDALMWIPLDRLFAVDRDSPEYREPEKKHLYYAETWALIHYLSRGNEARTPQLGRFMTLLAQGTPQDAAFREAFQCDYETLYGELTNYVRNNKRFFYNRTRIADLHPPAEARVAPMSAAQVLVRLGDLLASLDERAGDAERFYTAALAADPTNAGALGGLGWLRREQERHDEAAELLTRAADGGASDYRVYYGVARLRWDELVGGSYNPSDPTPKQRELLDAARAALRKSIELEPDFAEARLLLGRTYRLEPRGANLAEGIAALEEARRRMPQREDVAADLALLYRRSGEDARADALVGSGGGAKKTANAAPGDPTGPGSFQARMTLDFDAQVERINSLIAAGKLDEAIAVLDELIPETGGETRVRLTEERERLRKSAAHKRAVTDYNSAIALYNKRDTAGALAALRKLAEGSDPEVAAKAREKIAQLSPSAPKK